LVDEINFEENPDSPVVTPAKASPSFDDMKVWAEDAYRTDIDDLPAMIHNIIGSYNLGSLGKINLINVSVTCLIKAFFENKLIEMSDGEVDTAKWILVKMLFPNMGNGPISIIQWSNLLSPSAEPYFKHIYPNVFAEIQNDAKILVERHESGRETFTDEQVAHWKSIIEGNVPFGYRIVQEAEEPTPSA